jgi:hypothetical protein
LTRWNYIAQCLAANGYVVASIRHYRIGSAVAKDDFLNHVSFLLGNQNSPLVKEKVNMYMKPLILMGASEGGQGAILAAEGIAAFQISNVISYVNAVIALAPPVVQSSNFAYHLLIMQGTHDGDAPKGGQSVVPFEKSQAEKSQHFIWVHGANHCRFVDLGPADPKFDQLEPELWADATTLTAPETQRVITTNYVLAFLRWTIEGKTAFRSPFVGDGSFDFASSSDMNVKNDLSKGLLRVYPRYHANTAEPPLCGVSEVVFSNMRQGGQPISGQNPAKSVAMKQHTQDGLFDPQVQVGFLVEWVRADVPMVSVPIKLNLANFSFIEFEATLAHTTANPPEGLTLPIRLTRTVDNKKFYSNWINVPIPPPRVMTAPNKIPGRTWTRAMLSTIRIPLSAWGDVSGSTEMTLNFYASNAASGRIALSRFRAKLS